MCPAAEDGVSGELMGVESAVPSVHGGALGAPYVCRRGLLSSSARQRRAPAVAVLMLLLCELVLLACRLPCRAAAAGREWTAPPEEDSARAAFAKPGVAGKAGFFELAPGYTEAKLLKDFTSCSRTHNLRMKCRQKRWEMYCSIAMLVELGAFYLLLRRQRTVSRSSMLTVASSIRSLPCWHLDRCQWRDLMDSELAAEVHRLQDQTWWSTTETLKSASQ